MPRVLITGANRGLGLEFARQYAADGWDVLAACRHPDRCDDLGEIRGQVSVLPYDAASDEAPARLARSLEAVAIDVLILNAGVGSGGSKTVAEIDRRQWMETIGVNTFAPAKLALALRANLERGEQKKLVGVSSLAASIASYEISGHYAYRASKAALNSIWRSFSVEWQPLGIVCLLLRPGRVRTRMTQFAGDLDPAESVAGMRRQIASSSLAESGRFFGYDGAEVPW